MVIAAGDGAGNALIVIFTVGKAAFWCQHSNSIWVSRLAFGYDVDQTAGTAAAVQGRRAGDHFNMIDIERIDRDPLSAVGA